VVELAEDGAANRYQKHDATDHVRLPSKAPVKLARAAKRLSSAALSKAATFAHGITLPARTRHIVPETFLQPTNRE
jgi:hypothetical protein